MSPEGEAFREIVREGRIRIRSVGICIQEDRLLCSRSSTAADGVFGLPGGGLDPGNSLEQQIRQEIAEETTATVLTATYRFVAENRFEVPGAGMLQQVEHYFEITIDTADVRPREAHLAFEWVPLASLASVDLRPGVVREVLASGRLRDVRHLVQGPG